METIELKKGPAVPAHWMNDARLKVKEAESRMAAGANANNVAINAPNNVDASKIINTQFNLTPIVDTNTNRRLLAASNG